MAAVDPTEDAEPDDEGNLPAVPRSTLRLVKRAYPGLDDDEDDELDDEELQALLEANGAEDDSDEDDEEANGGPSDPAKSKKQKQAAAIKKLLEATQADDDDEDMEDAKPNGVKGKGKALTLTEEDSDEDEEDSDDDSEEGGDLENFVICTLDTERVSLPLALLASTLFGHLLTCCRVELPAAPRHHRQPR